MKKILLLFHGNADVERGFSVNKECLIENLMDESLVAQRSTYSALCDLEDLKSFKVTKSLLQYAKNASTKRKEHLQARKMQEGNKKNGRKQLAKELVELQSKKTAINQTRIEELSKIEKDMEMVKNKLRRA